MLLIVALLPNAKGAGIFDRFTQRDGLISNQVFAILQDGKGRLWVAGDKGVAQLNGFSFSNFNLTSQLGEDLIVGLTLDHQQRVWAYSSTGKFFFYDGKTFQPFKLNNLISEKVGYTLVNNVCINQQGEILITTILGAPVLKISASKNQISEINVKTKGNRYFILNKGGNDFISGNLREKTKENVVFLSDSINFSIPLSGGSRVSKSHFLKLNNGNYLYAKDFELILFDEKGLIQRMFLEKTIEAIAEDADHNLWVGLNSGGVIKLQNGELKKRGSTSYLTSKSITDLYFDHAGNLWIGTANSGLYQMNALLGLNYDSPKVFSQKSDSNKQETAYPIKIENKTENGSSDKKLIGDQTPPIVFISAISINNLDTAVLSLYDLKYNQNFIKFSFSGASASDIDQLQYRYKLWGINSDWIYTSGTEAQYTTLPPGNYMFEVNAMSKDGIWGETSAKVNLKIHFPIWQKWWFILAMVLLIGLIIFFIVKQFIKNIKEKEKQKAAIEKRIADLELQALRAQMNPHFLFNTISSIQFYITANDNKSAIKYLSKFAKLMRAIMENSKSARILISEELRVLNLYLELERLRFKDKFTYELNIDPKIDVDFEDIPPMLIQPYLENALNHGIINKQENGHILVTLKKENQYLVCTVSDDGIGRAKAQEIKQSKGYNYKSRGMSITHSRLEIINKMQNSNLNVEVEDLYEKDIPAGTKVKIYIPIKPDEL